MIRVEKKKYHKGGSLLKENRFCLGSHSVKKGRSKAARLLRTDFPCMRDFPSRNYV